MYICHHCFDDNNFYNLVLRYFLVKLFDSKPYILISFFATVQMCYIYYYERNKIMYINRNKNACKICKYNLYLSSQRAMFVRNVSM